MICLLLWKCTGVDNVTELLQFNGYKLFRGDRYGKKGEGVPVIQVVAYEVP